MKTFKEVIVETTTKERAFITYNEDGTIAEYETRDLYDRINVKELEVLDVEECEY